MMEQGITLQPMQMAYIVGPHVSMLMWMSGSLPHALDPESGCVWRGTPEIRIEEKHGNGKFQLFAMTRSLLVMQLTKHAVCHNVCTGDGPGDQPPVNAE
jgi:hypothetical protein